MRAGLAIVFPAFHVLLVCTGLNTISNRQFRSVNPSFVRLIAAHRHACLALENPFWREFIFYFLFFNKRISK